ncbi:PucR family transcriptional regulator [Actinokineospora diospyrosa]|uniref:PucR C-terminal helix-turn-helix domain-containing protein n=1 Tax=Actinokineospora diospyrosa TaxID=103728 RepID=A0ABT1ID48_9PSEU|nr:PucR family transcriptional regulator [Actinokineospora diospyrosa]MCP2270271.1 PucR C-terminal helix-turn-helix domain-containing protein [Actinokineospora diospyrosa]
MARPSVRNLLAEEPLNAATVVGGSSNLDTVPSEVLALAPGRTPEVPRGAIVVTGALEGYELELLLRRVHDRDASLVVTAVDTPRRLLSSTTVLAERLALPLAVIEGDPLETARRLWVRIHEPASEHGLVLARLAKRLHGVGDAKSVVKLLNSELGVRTALVGAEHVVLAGTEPRRPLHIDTRGGTKTWRDGDGFTCLVPIKVGDREPPRLWLVAETGEIGDDTAVKIESALNLAACSITAWAATERLRAERDATFHSTVLAELLSSGPQVPRRVLSQAVAAGWQLEGWHIGVHLLLVGGSAPEDVRSRTRDVRDALHFTGPLVERGDGWSTWITDGTEATPERRRDIVGTLNAVLPLVPDSNLVAGVGRPLLGAPGLVETLVEAQELSRFAGSARGRQRVEFADEAGVRRLLAAATSEDVRARSQRMLGALLSPANADLARTLETYLDLESSATSTAARLGIHRNTVVKRLSKIEELLGANLSDPEVRLALHLACRAK